MFLAAFDTRVEAVVSSCGWTTFADYHGGNIEGWAGERYMPRLRTVFGLNLRLLPSISMRSWWRSPRGHSFLTRRCGTTTSRCRAFARPKPRPVRSSIRCARPINCGPLSRSGPRFSAGDARKPMPFSTGLSARAIAVMPAIARICCRVRLSRVRPPGSNRQSSQGRGRMRCDDPLHYRARRRGLQRTARSRRMGKASSSGRRLRSRSQVAGDSPSDWLSLCDLDRRLAEIRRPSGPIVPCPLPHAAFGVATARPQRPPAAFVVWRRL